MAASKPWIGKINDVTECSMCTKTMVDPKILPCVHSFCFKCIKQCWEDKAPGDEVPCPMCGSNFSIPDGGLTDLPKNFFIEKLLDARNLLNQSQTPKCDICSGRDIEQNAQKLCVDCRQKLCDQCLEVHQMMNVSKSHQLVSTGNCSELEQLLSQPTETYCEQHVDRRIEIYCLECKKAQCTACFIQEHNGHKCADVREVAEDLKKHISRDIKRAGNIILDIEKESANVEELLWKFNENVAKTEMLIVLEGEKIKRAVTDHVQSLLQDLNREKSIKLKEIEAIQEELRLQKLNFENFRMYAEEVSNKAVPTEIAKLAPGLNKMARDLRNVQIVHIEKQVKISLDSTDTMRDSSSSRRKCGVMDFLHKLNHNAANIIGKIHTSYSEFENRVWKSVSYDDDPELVTRIELPNPVRGIVASGNSLFVTVCNSSEVHVFDTDTFIPQPNIPVAGLSNPWDMAATDEKLYVSDIRGEIFCIGLRGTQLTSWPVIASCPVALSVNNEGNVIASIFDTNELAEYTPDGVLQRKIALQGDVINPGRAIQLETTSWGNGGDEFLVCHTDRDNLHRVCLIDYQGQLVRSFGGSPGRGDANLNFPYRFVVDRNGFILVADHLNSRVVLLDKQLNYVKDLIPQSNDFDGYCFTACLDENKGRLYLADYSNNRISVYDL